MSFSKKIQGVDENTLDNLPVSVYLFDNKGVYFINKKTAQLFSVPKNKKIEEIDLYKLLDKKKHKQFRKSISEVIRGKSINNFELEFITFKNKKIFVEAATNLVFYKGKKVIQALFSEITERKSKTTEYEASQDLLNKIKANSLDVIFHYSTTPVPKLKFISDSSSKVLGYTPEQLYRNFRLLSERIHKEDIKSPVLLREEYLKLRGKQKEIRSTLRYKHKSGVYKHLEIVSNPIFDEKKKLIGLIGNMRDITDSIEAENQLRQAKEKFDLIVNNGNDVIALYTFFPKEEYLYISPNIKKVLGYSSDEVLKNRDFFRKNNIGDKNGFEQIDKTLRNYQKRNIAKNAHYIFKTRAKNGKELWMENHFVPITDSEGGIRFFLYVIREITAQKDKEIEIENQNANYKNLLDNSTEAYIIHDSEKILYVNNALLKLFKLKNSNIIAKNLLSFFNKDKAEEIRKRIKSIYKNNNSKKPQIYQHSWSSNGNSMEVEMKSVLTKFDNKTCILSLVSNLTEAKRAERDLIKAQLAEKHNVQLQKQIGEKQKIEKTLIEKTAQMLSIFESSSHLIWTVNRNYQVMTFNQNFHNTVQLQHNINIKPGDKIDEKLLKNKKDYADFWYTKYAEAFNGKKLEFEKEDINYDKYVCRKIFINPIYNVKGEITEISCIAHDITESKIYEQKLLSQSAKITAIFDSSNHYVWTINKEDEFTSFNKNFFDLAYNISGVKPYIGLNRSALQREQEKFLKEKYEEAFTGKSVNFELEVTDKTNKKIFLDMFLNPIYENENVTEVSGIAHNITDKKQAQQRMETSLKEKEVLLREVHHRVKNNMQVISSILNLQSSYVSDEHTLMLLRESQNRIKTMAYIHESLYQNKSFVSINFYDYVHTLVNNVIQSHAYSDEKIKMKLSVEKIMLSIDNSIPVGLIINELITNAIKHAFPYDRKGAISLNLNRVDNRVFLELKDNGVGFAGDVDFKNSHSLGLQLVNTLIEQLEGTLKFETEKDKGTRVLITFKM